MVAMITGRKRAVTQRIIDAEIEDRAEQRHAGQRQQERQPVRPAEIDGEHHHQIGGDHREFALREIHHIGGAEDQHEAERDQRIDGADADAGEQQLQYDIHHQRSVRGRGEIFGRGPRRIPASPDTRRPIARSIVEVDVLVEDDVALVVLHDVVAVQAVAVLVEIIFALGAREFLGRPGSLRGSCRDRSSRPC